MGKIKNQSDDEQGMDIQEDKQLPLKKKKLIVKKNRQESTKKSVSTAPSTEPVKNVVRQLAKQVNLKQRHKSLSEKQKIFDRIVKGLHEKSQISKKDKKKTRVILKKELRKHLQQQRIHARKRSTDLESEGKVKNQIVQIKNPEKFKKRQINERAKATQFKNLMGAGLANIRNLIASNTAINIHNQNRK